jgi:hypothetical protein
MSGAIALIGNSTTLSVKSGVHYEAFGFAGETTFTFVSPTEIYEDIYNSLLQVSCTFQRNGATSENRVIEFLLSFSVNMGTVVSAEMSAVSQKAVPATLDPFVVTLDKDFSSGVRVNITIPAPVEQVYDMFYFEKRFLA